MVRGSIEWEHTPEDGLVLRIKPAMGGLLLGETHGHMIAARREMLMAFRSILDVAIKRQEEKEKSTEKRGKKITVE